MMWMPYVGLWWSSKRGSQLSNLHIKIGTKLHKFINVNMLRLKQNGQNFAHDIFKHISLTDDYSILIQIS